jgi:hypothetical protein
MRKLPVFGSLLSLFAVTVSAQTSAQVNIAYSTGVPATPAPATILLTTLGLLATFIAYRKMRRLPMGRSLAVIFLAIGTAFFATKAFSAFTQASMTGAGPLQFTLGAGLTARVTNNTGASQNITSITLNPNPSGLAIVTPDSNTPQCTIGLTLNNGDVCYVKVTSPAF